MTKCDCCERDESQCSISRMLEEVPIYFCNDCWKVYLGNRATDPEEIKKIVLEEAGCK